MIHFRGMGRMMGGGGGMMDEPETTHNPSEEAKEYASAGKEMRGIPQPGKRKRASRKPPSRPMYPRMGMSERDNAGPGSKAGESGREFKGGFPKRSGFGKRY